MKHTFMFTLFLIALTEMSYGQSDPDCAFYPLANGDQCSIKSHSKSTIPLLIRYFMK